MNHEIINSNHVIKDVYDYDCDDDKTNETIGYNFVI